MRQIPILFLLGTLAACRPDAAARAPAQPGHPPDSERTTMGDTIEAARNGVEYEAPRLIPAMRAQLEVMGGAGAGATEGNVTGYRVMARDLVTAMLTDLTRVGSGDVEGIRLIGDSVLNLLGGGTGATGVSREKLARSRGLMTRLMDGYQEAMRAARP